MHQGLAALIISSVAYGSQWKERKTHDFGTLKLQRAREKWNEDSMKGLNSINNRLREKNQARAYIDSVNEAMPEY